MFKKILVAVDGSSHADKALEAGANMAAALDAELILLHILLRTTPVDGLRDMAERHGFLDAIKEDLEDVEVITVPVPAMVASASGVLVIPGKLLTDVAAAYLAQAKAIAEKAGVKAVHTQIGDGHSGREILAWADKCDADLIVLGSRGFGDMKSILLGSVSHKVTQESKVPCLIVK